MSDTSRLIEHAFPLKQASLDSVHEKNVRHGHISTLHIWPARRPLAACRAALIATLLPDPGTPEKRKELCEKIGGKVVKKIERKKMPNGQIVEREKEVTEGGILHWGRETENKEDFWIGFGRKSARPMAGARRRYLTRSREVGRFRLKPCAWAARRPPSTSTRSRGSSSNARSNIRRSLPGKHGPCRISS